MIASLFVYQQAGTACTMFRGFEHAHICVSLLAYRLWLYMLAVTTGSLAAYMGKGYWDKRKVFPQGVLAAMSTVLTLGYIGAL